MIQKHYYYQKVKYYIVINTNELATIYHTSTYNNSNSVIVINSATYLHNR